MAPILIDVPMPIVTRRLVIREPRVGDGAIVNQAVTESFEALHQWMPWAKTLPTPEDTEKYMRESAAAFLSRTLLHMNLWSADDARFVGSTGLRVHSWSPVVFEIGYWIRTSDARKGLMTEATIAVAEYAFSVLKADRVIIKCDEENIASARVAEKAGFTLEGVMRHDSYNTAGQLRSTKLYART